MDCVAGSVCDRGSSGCYGWGSELWHCFGDWETASSFSACVGYVELLLPCHWSIIGRDLLMLQAFALFWGLRWYFRPYPLEWCSEESSKPLWRDETVPGFLCFVLCYKDHFQTTHEHSSWLVFTKFQRRLHSVCCWNICSDFFAGRWYCLREAYIWPAKPLSFCTFPVHFQVTFRIAKFGFGGGAGQWVWQEYKDIWRAWWIEQMAHFV